MLYHAVTARNADRPGPPTLTFTPSFRSLQTCNWGSQLATVDQCRTMSNNVGNPWQSQTMSQEKGEHLSNLTCSYDDVLTILDMSQTWSHGLWWALMGFARLSHLYIYIYIQYIYIYTRITLSIWGWPIQSSSNCDIRHSDRAWTEVPRLVQGLPWSHQLSGLRLSLLRLQPGPSGPGLDSYRTIFQRCGKLQNPWQVVHILAPSSNISTFSTFQFCLVVDDCDAVNPLGQERSLARAKNQGIHQGAGTDWRSSASVRHAACLYELYVILLLAAG